jgi:LPS sulfotransferase NodH
VRIDAETLAEFRRSIVGLAGDAAQAPSRKNPSAVFVLGTPRSGSTLLRALLGGSSRLFAPPELFLLSFDDLAAREAWFQGSQRFLLEGNLRMLMQLRGVGLAAAQRLSASLTARRTPVAEYYGMVQDWLGDRLLVDKTPFYAAHAETLARAERDFAEPRFVHLVRHPYGMIRSFEEAKLEQLWWPRLVGVEAARARPNPYPSRTFAELVWITLHRNILAFLRDVPPARRLRVRFEDLVRSPREELLRVSGFLGIALEPAMLDPHADAAGRMTDGIYPVSRMIGDMKFHQHRAIDPATADTWKRAYATDFLSDAGWELAAELGYDETVAAAQDREEFVI